MNSDFNIQLGCVIYTETPTGITAEWIYKNNEELVHGKGIGIRTTHIHHERRFEGEFDITYTYANGDTSPMLKLIITFEAEYYNLTWTHHEKVTDIGIGIERNNSLVVSYTEVK